MTKTSFNRAGIDEVGRGPLAGPVTVSCVRLKDSSLFENVDDSKKLSRSQREQIEPIIKEQAVWAIVSVGPKVIDAVNILQATRLGMALAASCVPAKEYWIDGNTPMIGTFRQRCLIGGDGQDPHISAASIIAKVHRDKLMTTLNQKYPGYGFDTNSGYPTKVHREALLRLGASPVHRLSYAPVKELTLSTEEAPPECYQIQIETKDGSTSCDCRKFWRESSDPLSSEKWFHYSRQELEKAALRA